MESSVSENKQLEQLIRRMCSEAKLGSSPVSPLSVVPDFVVGLVSDPVWHRSVLLYLLGQPHLLSECLNGTLNT